MLGHLPPSWSSEPPCPAAAGGQRGALGPRPVVEEALLDVQPTQAFKWQLTVQAREPPNQGGQADPRPLIEP